MSLTKFCAFNFDKYACKGGEIFVASLKIILKIKHFKGFFSQPEKFHIIMVIVTNKNFLEGIQLLYSF